MTCVKTGAVIIIEPHSQIARCDAFSLSGVMYFRIVDTTIEQVQPGDYSDADIDYRILNWDNWFVDRSGFSTMIVGPGDYERVSHEFL